MHRIYIGDMSAYNFFGLVGYYVMLISTLFYYKSKQEAMGLYSREIIFVLTKHNGILGKVAKNLLFVLESYLAAKIIDLAIGNFNRSFGNFIGTGANYFGMLLTILFFWVVLSLLIMANTLKLLDISTMYLPLHLVFVKISCYFAGCCYGIPWEYGPYNHHPDHPGNQVPVQLIEAFWALLIFFFLLWYRKRAKSGELFPVYMILYSTTRFFSEFLRNEENVVGPLKIYHILCLIGIAYGIFHLLFLHFYRDTINNFFEKIHSRLDKKTEKYIIEQQAKEELLKRKNIHRKKRKNKK